jgi:putative CRISPR-associated protein (TIGR02619 family)
MARVLITTVGTSLLTNRDARPWSGWNGRHADPLPDSSSVDGWLAAADPAIASAETNTLRALAVCQDDRLVFLHSDTPEGRYCSNRLSRFYRQTIGCIDVEERQISALGYQHASFAQRGLRSLVSVAIASIREAKQRGHFPVFCATGGFKAEIAFLNLLGALLDVEVFYIHEQFREIVRLPRLPLAWDSECVVQHQDFFDWIDAEPRPSQEVESWLHGRPALRPLIEDDPDGHTYLNAAGDLLYQAARARQGAGPRAAWPEPVARPPAEKNGVSAVAHHRPRGWERFVERLCSIDCVSRVSYDESAHGGPQVKVLDAPAGALGVRFGSVDASLPLRVETTARGEAQSELVAEYLRARFV